MSSSAAAIDAVCCDCGEPSRGVSGATKLSTDAAGASTRALAVVLLMPLDWVLVSLWELVLAPSGDLMASKDSAELLRCLPPIEGLAGVLDLLEVLVRPADDACLPRAVAHLLGDVGPAGEDAGLLGDVGPAGVDVGLLGGDTDLLGDVADVVLLGDVGRGDVDPLSDVGLLGDAHLTGDAVLSGDVCLLGEGRLLGVRGRTAKSGPSSEEMVGPTITSALDVEVFG
mmetsp:Transcript_27581/g.49708  ORF Transcript_27581/g.49708 Transcript_27581/m.49708 type:complete len:227 (+) Transcript_27581:870-1550(+)